MNPGTANYIRIQQHLKFMLASCYKSNAQIVGPEKNNIIETMEMMKE